MPITRLGPSVLSKVASGGGVNFGTPVRWNTAAYGAGWPVQPVSAPKDVDLPRELDYPISVNATLTPRTGWGLMPFASLLSAYENVTECKMPVGLIHRELTSFIPRLVDADGNAVEDHDYAWMTISPDRKTPFSVWMTRFLKSAKVYDAPALYFSQSGGKINAIHYIDGSTLFLIIDEYGNTPAPENTDDYIKRKRSGDVSSPASTFAATDGAPRGPSSIQEFIDSIRSRLRSGDSVPTKIPAYTQVIKGTPFSWWSSDQVWYMPASKRMNAPYGESFIEQAWAEVQLIVNIKAFELGHYRTGNMPEGYVTLPRDLFPNAASLLEAERTYNARMSSGATERMRVRYFPDGTHYTPTKKPEFPDKLYKLAWNNILHAVGIPPSEFGDIPGGGLGGKGFKEGAASDLSRNTLNPHRQFIANPFNYVLQRDGVDDVVFELGYPTEEIDPDKMKASVYEGLTHGVYTMNDAMGQLGLNPVEGSYKIVQHSDGSAEQVLDLHHIANKHLIVAQSAIYVVEDMNTQNGMAVPTFTGKPGGNSGGEPVGPETAVEQDGKTHTSEDNKTVLEALQNVIERGKLTSKFISVPQGAAVKKIVPEIVQQLTEYQWNQTETLPDHDVPGKPGADEAAKPDNVPEPVEHKAGDSSVSTSPSTTSTETTKLDKHCGVCPDDDDYFGGDVAREAHFTFPDGHHANEVEIVAVQTDNLPAKPFLFKPLGGEQTALQGRIGGPMYVREEAAYILDRALRFFLVPVAFVVDAGDDPGAAIYYTAGMQPGLDPEKYAPEWIERAAVLDYISSQQDRGMRHNYGTHPDDSTRMILFDNGMSFPIFDELYCESPFCEAMLNKPLSAGALAAIQRCMSDIAAWHDIQTLVGPDATAKARRCAQRLLDEKAITPEKNKYVE